MSGVSKPAGVWGRVLGVRVGVGISIPLTNPYPWQGSRVFIRTKKIAKISYICTKYMTFPSEIIIFRLNEGILHGIRVIVTCFIVQIN